VGGPYRTIVVDDGSDVPLADVCARAGDWVTCLRQENAGPAAARNAGARAAEGAEILCFTDDDCEPHPEWAARLAKAQGAVPWRMVGGHVKNCLSDNVFAEASQSLCAFLYDQHDRSGGEGRFFTSNNLACRREDFLSLGGFDESFPLAAGEDRDLGLRWSAAGGALVYAEAAAVDHRHDLTLRQFLRQHANYGRGARSLHRALERRGDARPRLESLRFYLGLVTWPLRRPGRRRLMQAGLLGLSQFAMVAGYLMARRAEERN